VFVTDKPSLMFVSKAKSLPSRERCFTLW